MYENLHLTESDFERLLCRKVTYRELGAAHHHLFTCRACQAAFFAYDDARAELHLDELYGAPVWRSFDFWTKRLERLDGETALEPLLEHARELWSDAPDQAERVLTGMVDAIRQRQADPTLPAYGRLLARAHGYRANVYRIQDRFDEAEKELQEAGTMLRVFEGGTELLGELAWFRGLYFTATRRFDQAIVEFREAVASLPRTGPTTSLQATISLAIAYGEAGRLEESIATLETLLESYPASVFPPGSYLASLQSLGIRYAQTGRIAEARDLLPRIKELAEKEGKHLRLVRVKWLEALILKGEGKRTPAAMCFREVQAELLAANLAMDAALAGLDQAAMYLEHDDSRAAAELAEELVPIFRSKGIHREASAAGLIVLEALRRETATLDQVETLVERLQGRWAKPDRPHGSMPWPKRFTER